MNSTEKKTSELLTNYSVFLSEVEKITYDLWPLNRLSKFLDVTSNTLTTESSLPAQISFPSCLNDPPKAVTLNLFRFLTGNLVTVLYT